MQFRPTKLALLTLTALLALTPAHAPAQTQVESNLPGAGFDQPDTPTTAPTIQVYSREVVVDVTVTDDEGQPVHGLTKSDFTIEENGKPQSIRSFEEFGTHIASVAATPKLPPNTYSNTRSMPASGPVNIILLDVMHTGPVPMTRAKQQVAEYLRSMPQGTQVAIFDLSPKKGLVLLQPFTSDGDAAAAIVEGVDVEWIRLPPRVDTLASLNVIAAYVSGIKGRKNLLWFAPGAPLLFVRDGGLAWGDGDMTRVHRVMDTYEHFTEEQIAVFPMDPRGVLFTIGYPQLKAENIADDTGGEAFYNTNDLTSALAKAIDDGSQYYTLSYVPPRQKDDGHFHHIKIEISKPGLHLVYRKGYNSEEPVPVTPASKLQMTQDSMGLGALPSTQLLFDVKVTPSQTSDQRTGPLPARGAGRRALPAAGKTPVAYDLLYKLSQNQITFTVGKDGMRTASLEFDLAAYNSDGKLLTVRSQTLKLPLTPEEYQDFIEKPFQFYLAIDLPPGPVTLRAGVFDGNSNKAGTVEIPLAVPGK